MPRPHSHHIVKKSSDEIPHSLKRARNDRKITDRNAANAADAAERQADAAKGSRAAEQQSSEAAKQRSSSWGQCCIRPACH
ncbi:predicted protein [Botrytis cinerea T4]|uniref:Uncharacterized protein n=1 Tax=Botryotinia fuckeliana (strain T4) TaxID=999810 RepID=G2YGI9_BOTF4|nr:predicted protein [Botrytis cinerea T4]